jgi:hypothetical protein
MTQPTKTISRKVAIALAILCIATIVALNFSVINYYSAMNSKNNQIQTLNDQVVNLQTQLANGTITGAKLIGVDMQYNDNRTDPNAPYLQVTGYICNFGTSTANNCVLRVSATQSDNSLAIDSTTNIESIQAGNYTKVDFKFPYQGNALISFSSNLAWGN